MVTIEENNSTDLLDQNSNKDVSFDDDSIYNDDAEMLDSDDNKDMMAMYAETFQRVEVGEVVVGKIISIDKNYVLVDIGYKSEGLVPIYEFRDENNNITAEVGASVEAMIVERLDNEEERVIISMEKAAQIKIWDDIKKMYDDDEVVEGAILSRVKGGFSVDLGIKAFLPGSQADLRPIRNLDEMVGQTFKFKILKFNQKRNNIVLSRRAVLEQELKSQRIATLEIMYDGKVLDGVIKNITEYGVFVDLGGLDGLLHITDISWGRVKHPSELFSVGDNITVKVLAFDKEKERVSLGMKQLTDDPWLHAKEKYPISSRAKGKVVSLADYGAFVELEVGIEGLIHVSEMSWTRKIHHPSKMVAVGEEVETVVLDIQPENRRVSLGLKQIAPNPWEVISDKYPVGTTIEGKIKNITDFGLFIGIDEGIDGLVHISDISWTKRIKHPAEIYKKNDMIHAIVLEIDKKNERFSLGIKQLQPDPWEAVAKRYEIGKTITGAITNITDFGVFVEIEEGIEGLVHISEISTEKIKSPLEKISINEVVTAKVLSVNSNERRIALSIKQLETDDEKALLNDYISNLEPSTSTFGEVLRENLQEKLNKESE